MADKPPWDQRLARIIVRPLARTSITPNQVTILTLILALAGAAMFAQGTPSSVNWGASFFILARFMDHFDGELARMTGKTSRLGYYLDYMAGGVSYTALFICIGIGLTNASLAGISLGTWPVVLGSIAGFCAFASMFINLKIDRQMELEEGEAVGYPGFAGFELEDGIYLLGPVTWIGLLPPFFMLAAPSAIIYTLWALSISLSKR